MKANKWNEDELNNSSWMNKMNGMEKKIFIN